MSGQTVDQALQEVFGDLGRANAPLAALEERESKRKEEGGPLTKSVETEPPVIESTDKPAAGSDAPPAKDAKPKESAGSDAPPATEGEEAGRDDQSPDGEEAALEALVEKYQGNPKSMAKAIRGLRQLQAATAEDKKAVEEQIAKLDKMAEIVDRDYVLIDGELRIRPEVAARNLRAANQRPAPQTVPEEREFRAAVEAEFRAKADELFVDGDEEARKTYLNAHKQMIGQIAKERFESAQADLGRRQNDQLLEVGRVVDNHLREFPDDKELLPDIDKFYEGFPEQVRAHAILNEWVPIGKVAKLLRLEKNIKTVAQKAFELGRKSKGETVTPKTDGGAPARGGRATAPARGGAADGVQAFKDSIVAGRSLPGIDSIFSK